MRIAISCLQPTHPVLCADNGLEECMPNFYSEPFLHLAGLTHRSVLISWGAFYFKVKGSDTHFKLVDDDDLKHVHPPRKDTIGASSAPYGPARVEVFDLSGAMLS